MEYTLRWDTFKKWTQESIKDLYKDTDYTDITLVTEDMRVFRSHRIILSSSSDFFKEILGKMKGFQGQTLYLKEIQGCILGLLLNFIYDGEITVKKELIPNFLAAAVDLKIKGVDVGDHKVFQKENENDDVTKKELIEASLQEIDNEIKLTEYQIKEEESLGTEGIKAEQEDASRNKKYKRRRTERKSNSRAKKLQDSGEDFNCLYESCNETFNSGIEAKKHILKAHSRPTKEKKFKCDSCDKKFPTKHEARCHWVFRHGNGEKKFSCSYCHKRFFQSCDLKMHEKGVHLKIKDFHCSFCDLSFSQKCNLKTHMIKFHTEDYYEQLKSKFEH